MPIAAMPATSSSIWIELTRRSSQPCVPMDSSLAWCCRPVPVISKLGFTSVLRLWSLPQRPKSADSWLAPMAAISPAPTGAIWVGWPASPIRNPHDASTPTSLLGSKSSTPNTAWPAAAPRWSRPPRAVCPQFVHHHPSTLATHPSLTTRSPLGFQSTYRLLSLTRYRLRHLHSLDEPPAHCATLLPTRLEHRRSVDRQGSAFAAHTRGPSSTHPPTPKSRLT